MEATPEVFSLSEMWVALGIMLCSGLFSAYRDNRRALRHGLLAATAGLGILLISLMGLRWQWLGAFPFMVLTGLGLYLPYVLVHTTLFERLMAVTRDGGNLGFLMYLADSAGYLGYVGLMLAKKFLPVPDEPLVFFTLLCGWVGVLGMLCFVLAQGSLRRILGSEPTTPQSS